VTQQPVTIIAGPTASGKSARALQLARAQNGIIINADALQIYDALPLLTAQPSADDMASCPHALYGILPANTTCSVTDWLARAMDAIQLAWHQDQHPIVVGGTGLYLATLLRGLSPLPNIDDDVRLNARDMQAEIGNPRFHAELAKIDPVMAAKLNPNDTQRLIRAFEVMMATGKSLADWHTQESVPPLPDATYHTILIDGPREVLRARCRLRLKQMIQHGVMDEVEQLTTQIEKGQLKPDCAPTRALGYHAFVSVLAGANTLEQACDAAVIETGQYIKRQQTWFRHQIDFDEILPLA
jgi:tRNA dimethylallyltransferase